MPSYIFLFCNDLMWFVRHRVTIRKDKWLITDFYEKIVIIKFGGETNFS